MDQSALGCIGQVQAEYTGGVESDSEDRGRTYGDWNNGQLASPGPRDRGQRMCKSYGKAEQDRRMINARDQAVLDLTFGRRGE